MNYTGVFYLVSMSAPPANKAWSQKSKSTKNGCAQACAPNVRARPRAADLAVDKSGRLGTSVQCREAAAHVGASSISLYDSRGGAKAEL